MMFQWANKQLEKLSETLAPPPSTPGHRYLAAVASHQEHVALAILNDPHEPLDPYSSLNQKGMNALHAAASHGIVSIIRQLIGRGVRVDIADYNGWTATHHAAASSSMSAQTALATVKVLVDELGASVVMKDANAQTPYDVGSSQAVRGYLLPKQLQQETQECLDNGGAGLMPGIDMGGMKVNYSNLAPPPVIGTPGGAPPQPSMMNNNDASAALMQPPPVRGINSNFSPQPPVANNYNAAAASPAMMQPMPSPMPADNNNISQSAIPPLSNNTGEAQPQQDHQTASFPEQVANPTQNQPPVEISNQPPQQVQHQTSQSTANQVAPTEQPPKSNNSSASASTGYALRGGNSNSAFVLNESSYASSGRKLYKPDGFHTSSNDKDLQAKYGHVENSFETSRKLAVPPPPTSGGASANNGGANGMANPPPHSGGANPYSAVGAGNVRTMGYIGGGGRSRYPAYCAVSDSVSAPPSLGGFSPQMAPPAAPSYSTFNPGAMQQNAPAVPVQQWSGTQQVQNAHAYSTQQDIQYAAPAVQTQQWSGQNYSQSNVAPSYSAQSQQTAVQNQHSTSGYDVQPQQHYAQSQTIVTTDGKATTASSDAASMFATPHAEDAKAMFPSSGESAATGNTADVFSSPPLAVSNAGETNNSADAFSSPPAAESIKAERENAADVISAPHIDESITAETNNTADLFSSPPPAETNSADLKQQQSTGNVAMPPEESVSAPIQNGTAPSGDASSFFGATSESTTPTKAFGGLPPPPVFGSNTAKPSSAFSNAGGTSSLPPPPMLRSFSNQTPNNAVPAEDDMPTEQFADVSL